jgi:hypothetical protein
MGRIAYAATVYTENFNSVSLFQGASVFATNLYSEAWIPTTFWNINSANGWTFSSGAYYVTNGTTSQGALLLNEDGSSTMPEATRILTGLTAGAQYTVSFNYWVDNNTTGNYQLTGWIGASQLYTMVGAGATPGSAPSGHTGSFTFTATSTSAVLGFGQVTLSAASPIIDNISVATTSPVPLPAAAWLLLSGLGGLGAFTRRRQRLAPVTQST